MAGLRSEARRAELLRRATEAIVRGDWTRRDDVVWRREGEGKKEKRGASVAVVSLSKKDAGRKKILAPELGTSGTWIMEQGSPPPSTLSGALKIVLEVKYMATYIVVKTHTPPIGLSS